MADGVPITPGTGATIATDERTTQALSSQVQIVDPRNNFVRVQQTPTISTGIYAAGDAIGGLLTFASTNNGTGEPTILEAVTLFDKADIRNPITLVLFNVTFTPTADNAAFNPSDADMLNYVGHVPIAAADYMDASTNSAGALLNLDLPIIPSGTSVFGQMFVTSGTPTYASTTDLVLSLTFRKQ